MKSIANSKHFSEVPVSIELVKGFHLYRRRNEWINWDGDTSMVHRYESFRLSLEDAEQAAEKARIQGSSFYIDELPVICVKSKNAILVLGEVFSDSPFSQAAAVGQCSPPCSLADIADALPDMQWNLKLLFAGEASLTRLDGHYYRRSSSPGKGRNCLGWTLRSRKMSDAHIVQVASRLRQCVSHNKVLQDDARDARA